MQVLNLNYPISLPDDKYTYRETINVDVEATRKPISVSASTKEVRGKPRVEVLLQIPPDEALRLAAALIEAVELVSS